VQMSDLGEAVFSVIGVSVSDKNDFHRGSPFRLNFVGDEDETDNPRGLSVFCKNLIKEPWKGIP
jgi:hypothetical protein